MEKNMRLLIATAILSLGAIAACSADKPADQSADNAADASAASTADTAGDIAVDSAQVILDRHVAEMKAGNLEGVMADYADDALVIAPQGIVPGEANVAGFNVFD